MSAGGDSGEKTEQPTAKKLRDARERGNVAKSKDLSAAIELIGAILLLRYGGWFMAEYALNFALRVLSFDMPNLEIPFGKEIIPYAIDWFLRIAIILAPFLAMVALVAMIANLLQIGFLFTTEPLKLNFNKLNPVAGLKRLFSLRNVVMLVMNIAKLCIIVPIAWLTIRAELENVMMMVEMEAPGTFIYVTRTVLDLALKLAIILFILGVADYMYQKYKYTNELKMTKQEVKEEYKQMEGDPRIKQKRRQIQMQQAMQRMMSEVPQAEVVVRNPTHFAVAISCKPDMEFPVVVAKGKDKVAEKIINIALEAGVPTYENPPLARELFRNVDVGQAIPSHLYEVVAKIFAEVFTPEKLAQYKDFNADRAA